MNEYIASDLFRAAGVPTPRVAWATVRINDRKLGLYVLKEAFETEFGDDTADESAPLADGAVGA